MTNEKLNEQIHKRRLAINTFATLTLEQEIEIARVINERFAHLPKIYDDVMQVLILRRSFDDDFMLVRIKNKKYGFSDKLIVLEHGLEVGGITRLAVKVSDSNIVTVETASYLEVRDEVISEIATEIAAKKQRELYTPAEIEQLKDIIKNLQNLVKMVTK